MKDALNIFNIWVIVCWFALPINLQPQSKPVTSFEAGSGLNDQQEKGQGLFLQRCSLCHLPQARRFVPSAPRLGPDLTGLLKGAGVQKETAIREIILKGSPRMPGFQYGLSAKEIEDLVAYLKTL